MISEEDFLRAVETSLATRERSSSPAPAHDSRLPTFCETSELEMAFDNLDLDANGYLTRDELRVCLALVGQPVRENVLDMMMKLADLDGDGFVSVDDLSNFLREPRSRLHSIIYSMKEVTISPHMVNVASSRTPSRRSRRASSANLQLDVQETDDRQTRRVKIVDIVKALLGIEALRPKDIKLLYKKFLEVDSNRQGKLNLFQFEKIFDTFSHIDNRKTKSSYVSQLFSFCDADNSSFIDAKEFIISLCWLSDFGNIDKLRFGFLLFDIDGDGQISRGELIQLVSSINSTRIDKDFMISRVDEILQFYSKNSPDWTRYQLTFEELVQVADHNPDLFEAF